MKRVNQYQFYQLGHIIHPLTEIAETATIGDVWIALITAQSWLKFLLEDNLTPLVTCRTAAQTLLNNVARNVPSPTDQTDEGQQAWADKLATHLSWYERQNIITAAQKFETVF